MGLFDIFKKKECGVCGGEIGLFGNRKLEDANLCKECAKKLSPWFDDRRHSMLADIKAQLDYRKENEQAVKAFNVTRTVGRNYIVHFDESAKKFLVAATDDIYTENPDVLDYSQVTGCDLEIDSDSKEIMRIITDKEGQRKEISYDPPRFLHTFDYYMNIRVRHPYFDDMRFKLNNRTVEVELEGRPTGIVGALLSGKERNPNDDPACKEYEAMGEEIIGIFEAARNGGASAPASAPVSAPAAAASGPVKCAVCGAEVVPDASGRCEYCGESVR